MTENSQQGAEVSSRGNEARSKMGLGGGEACETLEECHFLQFYSPSSNDISHPAGLEVHHSQTPLPPPTSPPASSLPSIPPESCRQAFILILIKASGTAFHPQPCRPLSPSGEAVKLFIITRLSEMGEGHGCKALEWNLGRTLGDRRAEFDNR